ncbi:unnamed protein product [Polarella glacialis]|uniref:Uncharacterized protein n=2 Tax=Polarella glacialis TaxID=89957 RepID=A0A813JEI7_POLGL|nr:unnamed protein product [Polarella glacialis]
MPTVRFHALPISARVFRYSGQFGPAHQTEFSMACPDLTRAFIFALLGAASCGVSGVQGASIARVLKYSDSGCAAGSKTGEDIFPYDTCVVTGDSKYMKVLLANSSYFTYTTYTDAACSNVSMTMSKQAACGPSESSGTYQTLSVGTAASVASKGRFTDSTSQSGGLSAMMELGVCLLTSASTSKKHMCANKNLTEYSYSDATCSTITQTKTQVAGGCELTSSAGVHESFLCPSTTGLTSAARGVFAAGLCSVVSLSLIFCAYIL